MRRLAHHLLKLLTTLSLVLCVAIVVLWSRSYQPKTRGRMVDFGGARGSVFDAVPLFARPDRSAFVGSAAGRVLFIHQSSSGAGPAAVDVKHCGVFGTPSSVTVYSPPHVVEASGFLRFGHASQVFSSPGGTTYGYSVVSVPYWAVLAVMVVLPTVWLRRRLVNRRLRRAGLCPSCGYDLRATPGRCPECGSGREGAPVQ